MYLSLKHYQIKAVLFIKKWTLEQIIKLWRILRSSWGSLFEEYVSK